MSDDKTIREPARNLSVAAQYDVVVAGGGIAGAAAAVAAARRGVSVCLLEKESALGGLATLGNVTVWLPICDGMGHQVVGGIGEEMLRLSVRDLEQDNREARFAKVPACWEPGGDFEHRKKTRFRVNFNPGSYLLALEEWLQEAGVSLWYDTRLCAVRRQGEHLTHAIVENKSGRLAVAGKFFLDTTGDADLCHLAGEQTETLDSNVVCSWFYYVLDGRLHLQPFSNPYSPQMTRAGGVGPFFRGDDGEQVSQMILGSRELLRRQWRRIQQQHPDSEVQPFAPPTIACFRATRRLVGRFSLARQHRHQWFEDTVALTGDWRRCGPVYAIPWRALCGVRNRNLAVAGRCFSVDTSIWDCTRAIPTCAVTGEAVGAGAALATIVGATDLPDLPVGRLQQDLRDHDGILDPRRVTKADSQPD